MGRSALIMVAGLSLVFAAMWGNMRHVTAESTDHLVRQYASLVNRNTANSACARAISQMWQNPNPLWTGGYSQETFGGAVYSTVVKTNTYVPAVNPPLAANEYQVETTAHYDQDSSFVAVRLVKPSFAKFASFTNSEAGIAFTNKDTLNGPAFTNGYFTFTGNPGPVFNGDVSSAKRYTPALGWSGGGVPVIHADSTFGRPPITLPTDLTALMSLAQSGGKYYTRDIWVQLGSHPTHPDSTPATEIRVMFHDPVRPQTPPDSMRWIESAPAITPDEVWGYSTFNGIVATAPGYSIHVWGLLAGRLTIAAGHNLYVEDNVVYYRDPRYQPSTDLLGLVAQDSVIVAWDQAHSATDPNTHDCLIDASIMALKSFAAEKSWTGPVRGTVTVLGGVVQNNKGQLGRVVGGILVSGYNKNYIYDTRLETDLPPSFPLCADLEVVAWHE